MESDISRGANKCKPNRLYLDDYTTGTRDRIMVTLINKDVQYPSRHVRLKFTIKANGFTLRTNDYAVITPIVLEPNIPIRRTLQPWEHGKKTANCPKA